MSEQSGPFGSVLVRQREIKARRFHPTGAFIEFTREEAERSIPDRFEQQVKKYPHRLAFKSRTQALTYEQLNQAAIRLAWAILGQCGPGEEPVALLLEQDAAMVVGMLGILKAGKIFVALDPAFPLSRNSYILDDSHASLMVTNHQNLALANDLAQNGCKVLNLDQMTSDSSTEDPGLSLPPDRLAFILYTSGSTGQPKGVILSHRALLHDIMRRTNLFGVCPEDRLSLLTSGTSEAVRNIFIALFKGASLYSLNIKEEGVAGLADWLIEGKITVYMSGPGPFRRLVETLTGDEKFPHLRLIRLGLDTVRKGDVELYKKVFSPDCILVHTLGTTECGTTAAYFIDKETEIPDDHVPVGYPVEDMEVLLLDDQGQEVGLNCPGEIAVKGRYLSPGYWRKPDITQASFRPDPSGGDARIYLTGDLGIRRPDGCLLHLGRKDFQVKVRGYRIELAEVELALSSIASIKEAAVVARGDQAGGQRLVAYVVPTKDPGPTVNDLRRALAPKLPSYMVPSTFVTLAALPLLPNGKINRLALPDPGNERPSLAQDFAAPGTPMEDLLASIWAGVLGIERVGIHDNFLDLGGDSLLAMRVLARLKKATGLRINPKELTFQTLGQMASYCDAKLGGAPRQKSRGRSEGILSMIRGAIGGKNASMR